MSVTFWIVMAVLFLGAWGITACLLVSARSERRRLVGGAMFGMWFWLGMAIRLIYKASVVT